MTVYPQRRRVWPWLLGAGLVLVLGAVVSRAGLPQAFAGTGTYEVGRDIAPGRYKTSGPPGGVGGPSCTWQISAGAGPVDWGTAQGPAYMPTDPADQLVTGQVVRVADCASWSMV
ncbi:hypothetical protein [Micromonospora sp. NPDC049645]|uniref:hypothetical protein n=1 Tax=Micromonospora sp. NPDC049645 TaxID=3155508 RepID=UPI0034381F5A